MNEVPQDIPSPVDFHSEEAAQAWAKEAEQKLPSRLEFFNFFVAELTARQPKTALELGSGPGFLAKYILSLHLASKGRHPSAIESSAPPITAEKLLAL